MLLVTKQAQIPHRYDTIHYLSVLLSPGNGSCHNSLESHLSFWFFHLNHIQFDNSRIF